MTSQRYHGDNIKQFRRTMVLLSVLALSACSWIASMTTEPAADREDHFNYVCSALYEIYFVSCATLQAPTIVYSDIINDASGWGTWYGVYYHGEPYIFINPSFLDDPDFDLNEVILHEMGHYVIYELDLPPKDDTCEGERVVRLISGGEWTDAAKKHYGCSTGEAIA